MYLSIQPYDSGFSYTTVSQSHVIALIGIRPNDIASCRTASGSPYHTLALPSVLLLVLAHSGMPQCCYLTPACVITHQLNRPAANSGLAPS